jgi:hypothetical protein
MGLDISYYSKIDFASTLERDDAEVYLYRNDMVFGQSDGIKNGAYDSYGEYGSFRAGSYSGYNSWRRSLAELVGYDYDQVIESVQRSIRRNESLNKVLGEREEAEVRIPFVELLFFSDCEGFIGPNTSAKLAKDFAEWEEKAKGNDFLYGRYQEWKKAFDTASDGGCVVFC